MQKRWVLTQFFRDENNQLRPVCSAYGGSCRCPMLPTTDDGLALVEMMTTPHQLDAAKQDPRVTVCPNLFDPSPLPQAVTDAYATRGATTGMSMGALMSMLGEIEPNFTQGI